jgi:hypothetical protein
LTPNGRLEKRTWLDLLLAPADRECPPPEVQKPWGDNEKALQSKRRTIKWRYGITDRSFPVSFGAQLVHPFTQ